MTFDLRANRGDATCSFTIYHWPLLLDVAKLYGWTPAGTERPVNWPDDRDRSGRYDTNDGGIVGAEDAAALADAVEDFLLDVPDEARYPEGVPVNEVGKSREFVLAMFSGPEGKALLRRFVGLCREGEFGIW